MLNDLSNDMAIMHSSEQTAEDRERCRHWGMESKTNNDDYNRRS